MKRPGRPPLDEHDASVQVCVTLPAKTYDALYAQAKQERLRTVPELIRRRLHLDTQRKQLK
jgi:hypothetical protein